MTKYRKYGIQALYKPHLREWRAMGFPLDKYDAKLYAWIVRHQTQMTSDNIMRIKPERLPVAHIRAAMEYFIENVKDSPQYTRYKKQIDRDVEETKELYGIAFGIYPIRTTEALGEEPKTT